MMTKNTVEEKRTESREIGSVIGKYPGVAGCSHDGAVYCVSCAPEVSPATMEWLQDGNPRNLPWTTPILRDDNVLDKHTYCANCKCRLPERR